MEVLELGEEPERRTAEAKIAQIQLNDDLPESLEENELKNTLSQPSAANKLQS